MTALYLLTNLFFLMAILQFAWLNFRHWPTIQFLLNQTRPITVQLSTLLGYPVDQCRIVEMAEKPASHMEHHAIP